MLGWNTILQIFSNESLKKKARIQYGPLEGATYMYRNKKSPDLPLNIPFYTYALFIQNSGKASANNVRIGHTNLPENHLVSPAIDYSIEEVKDSGQDIVFSILRPKEKVVIWYMSLNSFPDKMNTYVKSDEAGGKKIKISYARVNPKWVEVLDRFLGFIGLVALVYLAVIF